MFNKKGFTLIEFIVVMAIIGILVLMAAPKFMSYVERAHDSRLMNDMKVVQNVAQAVHADYLAADSGEDAVDENFATITDPIYNLSLEKVSNVEVAPISNAVLEKVNLNKKEELKTKLYVDKDFNVYTTEEPKSKDK